MKNLTTKQKEFAASLKALLIRYNINMNGGDWFIDEDIDEYFYVKLDKDDKHEND